VLDQMKTSLRVVLGLLALVCLIGMWRVVAGLGLQVPLDPNEGWNAYHAAAAMHGRPLYPPPDAYLVNNYPPLSYYVVGAAGMLTGDNIVAGRIVSLLAFLAIGGGLFVAARRLGVSREAALLAPFLFAAALLVTSDYVGMDDPQLLAHAVSLGGILVVLSGARSLRALAAAALLFVLAFFIKHAVVAMPLAATLLLLWHERRAGLKLAGFGLGFLLVGLLLFRLVYGVSLLSVIATARLYSFADLQTALWHWLSWSGVLVAALVGLAWQRPRDVRVQLCLIYAVIAGAMGIVFLGGAGVDPNVLFDADMALALSAALAAGSFADWRQPALAGLCALPLLWIAATSNDWQQANLQWHPLREESRMAAGDIAFMAARKGPALCEMLSFCYWAEKPPAVDVFNVGQQFDTGARSDAELVRQIQQRRFAVIQLDPDSPYPLGENVHDAMARFYRADHEDWYGTFYVPR
jgi:hypothetical protein